jgi:hypothetical protein
MRSITAQSSSNLDYLQYQAETAPPQIRGAMT